MTGISRIAYSVPLRVIDQSLVPAPIENSMTRTPHSFATRKWPPSWGAIRIRNITAIPMT